MGRILQKLLGMYILTFRLFHFVFVVQLRAAKKYDL